MVETVKRPEAPWPPRTFKVIGPTRGTTTTRPKGPILGEEKVGPDGEPVRDGLGRPVREVVGWKVPGKTVPCWDLRIDCDGHRWKDRHYAAGHAQAAKEMLESAFRRGYFFDPATKRFVEPAHAADAPTVFSETLAWWRTHWSSVEPKTRKETLRYICRPIRELTRPGAPSSPDGLDAYLTWQLVPPKAPETAVPAEHAQAAAWLTAASLPIAEADVATWQAYVDRWRINSRTGRPLAQATMNRHLVDIRQLWGWVCAVHELPDPWRMVQAHIRSSAGRRKGSTVRPVDRTIVLSPNHVRELAVLCGEGGFGPLAEVYVLLLGLAGGRPGESAGVETADLRLPAGVGEVRFRKTRRRGIDAGFLDPDDDPEWGPLKGREIQEERRAPIPSGDARRIGELLAAAGTTDGPLFAGWDWDKFGRDVWAPAKALMATNYASQPGNDAPTEEANAALRSALARLRLHDLRHAACSMWLNTPGVEVRVACEWSGHKRLSVFLDIYQGIMPGSQESAREKLDEAWPRPAAANPARPRPAAAAV